MNEEPEERQIHQWYRDLQIARGSRASLVDAIEQRIGAETNLARLRALDFLLAGEYCSDGRYAEEEAVYRALHRQYPQDPLPLVFLAGSKLYFHDQPEQAMQLIEEALEIANRTGNFRRLALGVKARTALHIGAHQIIPEILRDILALKFEPGNRDCGIERDFFDRTPAGFIDEQLAEEYDRRSRRKGTATNQSH
jgi:tetratricopeptide (TPR) repeat protein